MKSRATKVGSLKKVLFGILDDAGRYYPQLRDSLSHDKRRIQLMENQFGIRLYVEYLPELDNILLQALDTGEYIGNNKPLTGSYSNRIQVPRLFRGLYLLVFHEDGSLLPSPDTTAIFFCRQIFCLWKKLTIEPKKGATDETVSQYFTTDVNLPEPSSKIWADSAAGLPCFDSLSLFQVFDLEHDWRGVLRGGTTECCIRRCVQSLAQVSAIVFSTIGIPQSWDCIQPRHGKGVVSDLRKGDYKYSCTTWHESLEYVFPVSEFNRTSGSILDGKVEYRDSSRTSRLAAVPKTYKGPRLIASEPCCYQWVQQGLLYYIRQRVDTSWIGRFISFDDQTRNQVYATRGSVTGQLATLDLSEASDRLSLWTLERMLWSNPQLCAMLADTRSTHTDLRSFGGLADHRLRKFATMGSAMTFPVETLVFLCFALAAALTSRNQRVSIRNIKTLAREITVYGDDIIVPVEAAEILISLLELFKFKINAHKTFLNGKFRESCGVDVYAGQDVTPVKCKQSGTSKDSEHVFSLIDASNNLFNKGCWVAADVVKRQAQGLCSRLTKGRVTIPVRHVSLSSVGFSSYSGSIHKNRWNREYQRYQVRHICLKQNVEYSGADGSCAPVIQLHTEKPCDCAEWQSGVATRDKSRIGYAWE